VVEVPGQGTGVGLHTASIAGAGNGSTDAPRVTTVTVDPQPPEVLGQALDRAWAGTGAVTGADLP
jgi:hypothetical protein